MATTGATRRSAHSTTSRRQSDRRGRHAAAPVVSPAEAVVPVTRATHITPNVVIAARGDVASRGERAQRRTHESSALDLRRFRV